MYHIRITALALLASAAFFTNGTATAQGRAPSTKESRNRGPTDPAARAAMLGELGSWLGQLRGRFRITAPSTSMLCALGTGNACPLEGSAECSAAGDAADVSCLFKWSSEVPFLPRSAVYGINPEQLELRLHWLESGGTAVDLRASPKATRAAFKTSSGGTPVQIDVRPGGQVLVLTVTTQLRGRSSNGIPMVQLLELQRQAPGGVGE